MRVSRAEATSDDLAHPSTASMAGRTALVAGGGISSPAGSVGFATAWLLAGDGAQVAILDRDPVAAADAVEILRAAGHAAVAISGDATSDADCRMAVASTVAEFGKVDALVTTIARGDVDGLFEVDRSQWDDILTVNTTTAWQLIRHTADAMPSGSSIVTTSSGAAQSRGPGMPYSVAKAALEQLTVGAAATLAPRGIRVNAVRVGTIWSTFASRAFSPEQRETRARNVALGVEGTVWDVAAANLFLSGERARWVTGHVLVVDGGGPVFRAAGEATPANTSGNGKFT